jgi:hypothetical protein
MMGNPKLKIRFRNRFSLGSVLADCMLFVIGKSWNHDSLILSPSILLKRKYELFDISRTHPRVD